MSQCKQKSADRILKMRFLQGAKKKEERHGGIVTADFL